MPELYSLALPKEDWELIKQLLASEKESSDQGDFEDEEEYKSDQENLDCLIENIENLIGDNENTETATYLSNESLGLIYTLLHGNKEFCESEEEKAAYGVAIAEIESALFPEEDEDLTTDDCDPR